MTDPVISELEKALNDARRQKLNRTGDSEDDGSSSGSGKNSLPVLVKVFDSRPRKNVELIFTTLLIITNK